MQKAAVPLGWALGVLAIMACSPAADAQAAPANAPSAHPGSDWRQAPGIRSIRGLVRGIDTGVAGGKDRERRDAAGCTKCDGRVSIGGVAYRDSTGRIKRLDYTAGDEDGYSSMRQYYDLRGVLRFAVITTRHARMNRIVRMYFSSAGRPVHRDVQLDGEDLPFGIFKPYTAPDDALRSCRPAAGVEAPEPDQEPIPTEPQPPVG